MALRSWSTELRLLDWGSLLEVHAVKTASNRMIPKIILFPKFLFLVQQYGCFCPPFWLIKAGAKIHNFLKMQLIVESPG